MAQSNPFSSEIDFEYGKATSLSPLVRRLVAHNPGPFTFKGTNIYVLGHEEVAIIDPGPEGEAHVQTLLKALQGEKISKIFLTHAHKDHSGALSRLQELTGAETYGFYAPDAVRGAYRVGEGGHVAQAFADLAFRPDHELVDGDEIHGQGWSLRAVHTPGHAPDHICYDLVQEKSLFTGDHIMPWSTTVIAPPEGTMKDYMASLEKLLHRDDALYMPGHGGRVRNPGRLARAYILHRQWREKSILKAVVEGCESATDIVPRLYREINEDIRPAAALSTLAHLFNLVERGRIKRRWGKGLDSRFTAKC